MKSIITLSMAVLLAVASVATIPVATSADNGEDHTKTAQTPKTPPAQASTTADYKYIAQPGDSYSLMARKAIQTHGINKKLVLDWGQILAAETNLTLAAGSPLLVRGQTVAISQAAVKTAADAAKALPPEKVALWRKYLPGVNFNTNNVGEARS